MSDCMCVSQNAFNYQIFFSYFRSLANAPHFMSTFEDKMFPHFKKKLKLIVEHMTQSLSLITRSFSHNSEAFANAQHFKSTFENKMFSHFYKKLVLIAEHVSWISLWDIWVKKKFVRVTYAQFFLHNQTLAVWNPSECCPEKDITYQSPGMPLE